MYLIFKFKASFKKNVETTFWIEKAASIVLNSMLYRLCYSSMNNTFCNPTYIVNGMTRIEKNAEVC